MDRTCVCRAECPTRSRCCAQYRSFRQKPSAGQSFASHFCRPLTCSRRKRTVGTHTGTARETGNRIPTARNPDTPTSNNGTIGLLALYGAVQSFELLRRVASPHKATLSTVPLVRGRFQVVPHDRPSRERVSRCHSPNVLRMQLAATCDTHLEQIYSNYTFSRRVLRDR